MKIYNTLTRQKEEFKAICKDEIHMYVCGPTVYNYIHVGNVRPLVVFDTFRRFMKHKGYKVKYVVNFTDVDDKIIDQSKKENRSIQEITDFYIQAFKEDAARLNLLESETIHPRATEYVEKMVDFIRELEEKCAAYAVDGDVFFDISKAKDYGKLSKKNIDELKSGARIDIDEKKKSPLDFALWKKQKESMEPAWESPWGMGRPGWHIECSVMSRSILGDTIDIHAGGADLQFPHHENEIAQSETHNGCTFANYWMHNGMITVDKEKMSKSRGNFFLAKDIAKIFDMEIVRLWLLSVHYRNPIDYSQEVLEQTKASLERLYNAKYNWQDLLKETEERELSEEDKKAIVQLNNFVTTFDKHMEDDLNTADGISALFEMVRFGNGAFNGKSNRKVIGEALEKLNIIGEALGILYKEKEGIEDSEILALIEERTQARQAKNYARADEIRDLLKEKGIEIKDTSAGVKFTRVR